MSEWMSFSEARISKYSGGRFELGAEDLFVRAFCVRARTCIGAWVRMSVRERGGGRKKVASQINCQQKEVVIIVIFLAAVAVQVIAHELYKRTNLEKEEVVVLLRRR